MCSKRIQPTLQQQPRQRPAAPCHGLGRQNSVLMKTESKQFANCFGNSRGKPATRVGQRGGSTAFLSEFSLSSQRSVSKPGRTLLRSVRLFLKESHAAVGDRGGGPGSSPPSSSWHQLFTLSFCVCKFSSPRRTTVIERYSHKDEVYATASQVHV